MERYVNLFKRHVINFKLELCCCMAPVRSGLLAFACLHIAIGISTLMFFAEGSFEPLLLKALNGISSEPLEYGPLLMIVYAVELGSNVVLLCGIIRNDLVLLRVFMYFALGVLTAALMSYSVMFVSQVLTVKFLIAASLGHQIYILLLLRSAMIDIKQTSKQNEYSISYRKSSVKYSRSGSKDRYSVVIEPYRRNSSVSYVFREPYRRSSSLIPLREYRSSSLVPYDREPYRRSSSLVPYVRETDRRRSSVVPAVQENVKPIEVVEEENDATVIVHAPAKEEIDKEEMAKKGKEVKRKRNIFGRKQKLKKDDNKKVTNDS